MGPLLYGKRRRQSSYLLRCCRREYEIQVVTPPMTNTTPTTQRMACTPDEPEVKGIVASQAIPTTRKIGPVHRAHHCWKAEGRTGLEVTGAVWTSL